MTRLRLDRPPGEDAERGAERWLVLTGAAMAATTAIALTWAWRTEIDIAALGTGQIVPASRLQIVQNLEGGIVRELLAREGARVKAGEVIARIADQEFQSTLSETDANVDGLTAEIARLTAEASGGEPAFPASVRQAAPDLVAKELQLFQARRASLAATSEALDQEVARAENARRRALEALPLLRSGLKLAEEQRAIVAPQVEKGLVSELELLAVRQRILEHRAKIQDAQRELTAAGTTAREAERKKASEFQRFRSEALAKLTEAKVKLTGQTALKGAHQDRVVRREVRAPVAGVIKRLLVSTRGAVVRPGEPIAEIVPSGDELIAEARFAPQDIAFIHPGQKASVRITAYDASIYGALPAEVIQVSADATVTERNEVYYMVRVKALRGLVGRDGKPLPLIAGMVAQVDVLTGKRGLLDYLLKPLTKLQYTALHER